MALRRRRGATQATRGWRSVPNTGPGRRRLLAEGGAEEAAETRKASVRAKVEHPFLYVKRYFGYAKVRYRGVGEEHAAHRRAARVLQPPERWALHRRLMRGQSARNRRKAGGMGRWGVAIPIFLTRKHNFDDFRRSTHAPDSSNAHRNPSCSDLP